MITINNKSRYFSASEDMFPTMERNFAWLFGMQTPEQGWKAAMAKAIYRSARASSAEEWQYGFPIGDDGEPMLIEDDFLADLMAAYLEKLPDVAPQAHSFEERRAMMKRLFPLKHTKEYYEIRLDSVMNENPGEFTLEDYLRGVGRCAREELMDKFGPHDSGLDCYFQILFRKINRIGRSGSAARPSCWPILPRTTSRRRPAASTTPGPTTVRPPSATWPGPNPLYF